MQNPPMSMISAMSFAVDTLCARVVLPLALADAPVGASVSTLSHSDLMKPSISLRNLTSRTRRPTSREYIADDSNRFMLVTSAAVSLA